MKCTHCGMEITLEADNLCPGCGQPLGQPAMPKPGIIDFSAHILKLTRDFKDRTWIFNDIERWLANEGDSRYFLLTGEPGCGKSTITARLCQYAEGALAGEPTWQFIKPKFISAYHFCSARERRWINPHTFIESLAWQLSANHPAFAKALAEQSGDEKIRIDARPSAEIITEGGKQIGVNIEYLDVSRVSAEDAFGRVIRDPLEALYQDQPDTRVVILVDGLDEALTYTGDIGIVALLAQAEELPGKVRFLLTSRQESRIEGEFLGADGLYLSAESYHKENDQDIQGYIAAQLKPETFLSDQFAILSRAEQEKLLTTLTRKAAGNFRYISFLFKEIHDQKRKLTNLKGLPEGLDGLYYQSLDRLVKQGGKSWEHDYAPVLGILAVAQTSFTQKQLEAFSGVKNSWPVLTDLEQFIQTNIKAGEQDNVQYQLYHQSVVDFLEKQFIITQKKQVKNRYYLLLEAPHHRIIDHYLDSWGGLEAGLPKLSEKIDQDDLYGLSHLVAHLYPLRHVSQSRADLHALLQNQLFIAQRLTHLASPNLVLDDLRLALGLALENDDLTLAWQHIHTYYETLDRERKMHKLHQQVAQGNFGNALERTYLYSSRPNPQIWARLWIAWQATAAENPDLDLIQKATGLALGNLPADMASQSEVPDYEIGDLRDKLEATIGQLLTRVAHEITMGGFKLTPGEQKHWFEQLLGERSKGLLKYWSEDPAEWAKKLPATDEPLKDMVEALEKELIGLDPGAFRNLSMGLREKLAGAIAHSPSDDNWLEYAKRLVHLVARDDYPIYREMSLAWLASGALSRVSTEEAQSLMGEILVAALDARQPELPEDTLAMALVFNDPACCAADHTAGSADRLETCLIALAQASGAKNNIYDVISAGRPDPWAWVVRRSSAIIAALYRSKIYKRHSDLLNILLFRSDQKPEHSFAGYRCLAYLSVAFRWLELGQNEYAIQKLEEARKTAKWMVDKVLKTTRQGLITTAEGWINDYVASTADQTPPKPPTESEVTQALRKGDQLAGERRFFYLQFLYAIWSSEAALLKRLLPSTLGDLTTTDAVFGRLIGASVKQGILPVEKLSELVGKLSPPH